MPVTAFAYGAGGEYLIATAEKEVFVCSAGDQGTLWTFATHSPVVGVRATTAAILVLDRSGILTRLRPSSGEQIDAVELKSLCHGLAGTLAGRWAALTADGIVLGRDATIERRWPITQPLFAACADDEVAVATASALVLFDIHRQQKAIKLAETPTGLAWCVPGDWLVTTRGTLQLYARNLSASSRLATVKDMVLAGGVASPNGRFFAFRVNNNVVGLLGRKQGQLGSIQYADRKPGELEFGPHPHLGIGIGQGDGNRISLVSDEVKRTDPPPGRPINRWMIGVSIDAKRTAAELRNERPQPVPQKKLGCAGVAAALVLAALAIGTSAVVAALA